MSELSIVCIYEDTMLTSFFSDRGKRNLSSFIEKLGFWETWTYILIIYHRYFSRKPSNFWCTNQIHSDDDEKKCYFGQNQYQSYFFHFLLISATFFLKMLKTWPNFTPLTYNFFLKWTTNDKITHVAGLIVEIYFLNIY